MSLILTNTTQDRYVVHTMTLFYRRATNATTQRNNGITATRLSETEVVGGGHVDMAIVRGGIR